MSGSVFYHPDLCPYLFEQHRSHESYLQVPRFLLSSQISLIFFIEKWTWLHLTGKALSGKPVIMVLDKNLMDSLHGEASLECGQSTAMMFHSILHQEKSLPAIIVLNGTILSKIDIRI